MKVTGKLIWLVGKYAGMLVILGVVLNRYGLGQPWNFVLPLQVWVGSIVTGIICCVLGFVWNDSFVVIGKQQILMATLTNREKEIARLVIAGKSNKEICGELFIEYNTLKTHIRNLFRKANCQNRHEFTKLFESQNP